ncbi:protein kinase domain-containing protein [Streptomyces wedmorensis]|uniref:protein kinase domain-containing protein n=1 Tax=Streptomyces wedmorensis TaxID=43759 RepID=UPI0037AA94F2
MTVIAGRYRLLDVLAAGATGTVWRALDETRGHEVALKELRLPDGVPADDVPLLYARREREARAAARLSHPAVVTVHGVATEDGRPWVVMELVRGLTLAETLEAGGPLAPREAARVGLQVLGALRAAREAGVPHRGVAPEHVLLGNDGRVVVTGFGTDPGAGPGARPPAGPGSGSSGGAAGTTGEAGEAADLRSLGALLDATAGHRTGPLGALIEELLGEEPPGGEGVASPGAADRIERELGRLGGVSPRPARPAGGGTGNGRTAHGGSAARGSARGPARGSEDGRESGPGGRPAGGPGDADSSGLGPAPSPGPAETPSRPRAARAGAPRRGHVLVAGLVGALLIAGALTYQAVRDDGSGAGPGGGGATSTAPAGSGATGEGPVTPRP